MQTVDPDGVIINCRYCPTPAEIARECRKIRRENLARKRKSRWGGKHPSKNDYESEGYNLPAIRVVRMDDMGMPSPEEEEEVI